MNRALAAALLVVAGAGAAPAHAQQGDSEREKLRFCPNRPSLGSAACTTDPGHVQFEISTFDWQRDTQDGTRTDTIVTGDTLARVGLTNSIEAQIAWTAYGHVREQDRLTGAVGITRGIGDLELAVQQNISHPDGHGLSIAITPHVTLPTGGRAIGAGDWAAGVMIPVNYDITDALNVQFTGEADAAVDDDRDGRHFAYSGIWGFTYQFSEAFNFTGEFSLARDDDPMDATTQALAAGSVAWQPRHGVQLDFLTVVGLNRASPDIRLVTGGAFLF